MEIPMEQIITSEQWRSRKRGMVAAALIAALNAFCNNQKDNNNEKKNTSTIKDIIHDEEFFET